MKKPYLFFITVVVIIILDQVSKYLVKVLDIPFITNTGSLFGMFGDSTLLLIWLSIVIIGIFLYYYDRMEDKLCLIGSGLIVGGAVGNLIDRFAYRAVIDFIDVGWWPSFNIADSAISIGVILLIVYFVIEKKDHKSN